MTFAHLGHAALYRRLVAHVEGEEARHRPQLSQFFEQRLRRLADIQPHHLGALGSKAPDAGQADTRSGAGDYRDLVMQTSHVATSLVLMVEPSCSLARAPGSLIVH